MSNMWDAMDTDIAGMAVALANSSQPLPPSQELHVGGHSVEQPSREPRPMETLCNLRHQQTLGTTLLLETPRPVTLRAHPATNTTNTTISWRRPPPQAPHSTLHHHHHHHHHRHYTLGVTPPLKAPPPRAPHGKLHHRHHHRHHILGKTLPWETPPPCAPHDTPNYHHHDHHHHHHHHHHALGVS